MQRWYGNEFENYNRIAPTGYATPYFWIVYKNGASNYICKTACHDLMVQYNNYSARLGTAFLIQIRQENKEEIFNSISSFFEVINTHYKLRELDHVLIHKTDDERFWEVTAGPWWCKFKMRKYLMLKLMRFAYNYRGEFDNSCEQGRLATIDAVIRFFANETLASDLRGKPVRNNENTIVFDWLKQVTENVQYAHLITNGTSGSRLGFITTSAIPTINNYLKPLIQ